MHSPEVYVKGVALSRGQWQLYFPAKVENLQPKISQFQKVYYVEKTNLFLYYY